jgi:hypothetical protein
VPGGGERGERAGGVAGGLIAGSELDQQAGSHLGGRLEIDASEQQLDEALVVAGVAGAALDEVDGVLRLRKLVGEQRQPAVEVVGGRARLRERQARLLAIALPFLFLPFFLPVPLGAASTAASSPVGSPASSSASSMISARPPMAMTWTWWSAISSSTVTGPRPAPTR